MGQQTQIWTFQIAYRFLELNLGQGKARFNAWHETWDSVKLWYFLTTTETLNCSIETHKMQLTT
jgi:hypothetical protein